MWCTLHPTPAWLLWAHCSGGKEIHQYPYIPPWTSWLLYLEVSMLSGDASSVQFPLEYLCLQRLLPYSKTEVLLPCEEREWDLRYIPTPKRFYEKDPKKSTASLTQCHYQSLCPHCFPLHKKAVRLRRNWAMNDQATTQPFNYCRTIIRQKPN